MFLFTEFVVYTYNCNCVMTTKGNLADTCLWAEEAFLN